MYGPNGEALYSWRVAILPYLEGGTLYDRFHKDEPWDSPHNIQLLADMPLTYAPPSVKKHLVPPNHTICHVFVGPGTAFEEGDGVSLRDFSDGVTQTLLIVEAGKPVPWTKPENIAYDPGRTVQVRGIFPDMIRTCLADGSSHRMKTTASQATWHAAITRNGREMMGEDW